MKVFLSMVILFLSPYSAFAQDTRKYFEYTDTSFEVGEVKILGNVNYNFDTIYEPPRPQPSLDSLSDFLRLHPQVFIEISCHTDNQGRDQYNLKLSEVRARSAYEFLKMKGIPDRQLTFKGYGKTLPIAPNEINGEDNPEGRQLNRRTELKITSVLPSFKSLDNRKHFEYIDTSFTVGEIMLLDHIYFKPKSSELSGDSSSVLDTLVEFLKAHRNIAIEVANHLDEYCTTAFCTKLRQKRSQAIRDYLILNGVEEHRLYARGYGPSNPVYRVSADGITNEPLGKTEIKIISVKR